jgi:HK97 family phage major capsid protein
MAEVINAPAGAPAEPQQSPSRSSRTSTARGDHRLGKANNIDERACRRWIEAARRSRRSRRTVLDVMEAARQGGAHRASAVGLSNKETQRYSLFRAIRAMVYGERSKADREAAFERECSAQVAKQLGRRPRRHDPRAGEVLMRPLGEAANNARWRRSPGSKGGYMVGVENMGFIDILRNRSVAMRMGARQLSGLTGNVMFPRQTGKPTVTWQGGDGTSVTATDQTLGQLSMTPKTASRSPTCRSSCCVKRRRRRKRSSWPTSRRTWRSTASTMP